MSASPRVLVFLLSPGWMGISRLPKALTHAGFQVATLSLKGSYLSQTEHANRHVVLSPEFDVFECLLSVLRDAQPDLIIPGCEAAVQFLHEVERFYAAKNEHKSPQDIHVANILALVRRSLGSPEFYHVTLSKHTLLTMAREMGIRVPDQVPVHSLQDALLFAQKYGYPVVLKKDHGSGGKGVRICSCAEELEAGLQALVSTPTAVKSLGIMAQQFIRGLPVMQAFSAMSGNILERITTVKEQCHPALTGPSSVVRFIEQSAIDDVADTVLASLRFSGFASLEFVIEEGSQLAYLIEMNPRPCPISHMGHLVGRDLARALWCQLTHNPYERSHVSNSPERIALFPQEWLRDPHNALLSQGYHDVPWDDPVLLRALINGKV